MGTFALFRENADLLRALNKRLKLFRGEDGWFARGRQGQLWEWGRGKLGFTVGTAHMIGPAAEAGFVAAQRGDTEANFSCPWTEENIDRLIKLLRLKIRRPASVPSNPFQNRSPDHRNGENSGGSEWIESLGPDRASRGTGGQMIVADTGPPKMRRPSWKLGRHKVSMEWTTIDGYPAAAQLSSDLCDWPAPLSVRRNSPSGYAAVSHPGRRGHALNVPSVSASSAIYSPATAG